ncbi:NAD(P)H-dependent oxidoreductase [Lachnospiraceae bacterium 46-61]
MKNELILIQPHCEDKQKTKRLEQVLQKALEGISCQKITKEREFENLQNKKILFAISQGVSGINLEYFRFLKKLRINTNLLENSVAGIIVDGESELYTKSIAREFVFTANQAGCTFPGRPLVEATASLQNFNIQAKILETDNMGAYEKSAQVLIKQILSFSPIKKNQPNILVLHASNFKTSNTSQLWNMVKQHLTDCKVKEISLRNGSVQDCSGCPYTMCMHFSSKSNCYYGGVIVDEVYPAILECDALVLLCPNYNDAVSANLCAFINRLTALFRKTRFYEKHIFGIIVSGYSGGDLVAEQLISALNMNKTFILPSRFALLETANDPNSIQKIEGIQRKAKNFAYHILKTIKTENV